jgi:anti-sigma28 factor (negative regulator of flagellin synthesis)
MDRLDEPRDQVKPANEIETVEAQESGTQPSDREPPIDEARREKIEKLNKAVADGTYSVSAEEVASKLIEHMLEPKE